MSVRHRIVTIAGLGLLRMVVWAVIGAMAVVSVALARVARRRLPATA